MREARLTTCLRVMVVLGWLLFVAGLFPSPGAERLVPAGSPMPRRLAVGQMLKEGEDSVLVEVEGKVVAVNAQPEGLELDLRSGSGRMRVRVEHPGSVSPTLLLNSRIQATGLCQSVWTLDGQRVAGLLTVTEADALRQLEMAPELWAAYPMISIRELWRTNSASRGERLAHVGGRIVSVQAGRSFIVADGTGQVRVETTQMVPQTIEGLVEVLGRLTPRGTNVFLACGFFREMAGGAIGGAAPPAVLTTARQIKRLKREEALRGYPVLIRGIITCVQPKFRAMVIQDSTLGIYVKDCPYPDSDPPRVGQYWEVEGVTDSGFAPMISPRRAVRLGEGLLPEPIQPTWDQLMNGSLDTQYVELQGIVVTVSPMMVTLLTRAGRIMVVLSGYKPPALKPLEGSLVTLRGCLFARHSDDKLSHEFRMGEIELHNAVIKVDEPAPADVFARPLKRAADLMLFDADAGAVQRLKISGQIVQVRQGVVYLMDGSNGLRCIPQSVGGAQVSNLVEVVGFPELGEPSPVLHEAVVRTIGCAPLPPPKKLGPEDLFQNGHDSTRVQIEAVLVSLGHRGEEQVLELQAGVRKFLARLERPSRAVASLRPGSRLELTGVYAGQGGNPRSGQDLTTFELLLGSTADIRALQRPPWWTLGRSLAVIGALIGVLALALVWISLLRTQVDQRTIQLKQAIHIREHAEHEQALEQERSRIARDLHDDLGSTLTEISMLAESGRDQPPSFDEDRKRFERILARAHALVRALDEIVWAVDPRKDTLPALARYLAAFAEEYLSTSGLACRIELPPVIPEHPVAARERHELFLAVKESLNNAVKHSGATQVLFRIEIEAGKLLVTISDNGHGFDATEPSSGNGLVNLQQRLVAIQGACELNSHVGNGTTVSLSMPLSRSCPV